MDLKPSCSNETDVSLPECPDVFQCAVCMENMVNKDPRLLRCGHTFCTPCLQQLIKTNTLSCPKCRKRFKLPAGGVTDLPRNVDLGKMVEMETALRSCQFCSLCKKSSAEFYCDSCPRNLLCGKCADKHKVISVLKSHNITQIKSRKNKRKLDSKECLDHEEDLEFYCRECNQYLCTVCTITTKHEGHLEKVVEIKTELESLNIENVKFGPLLNECLAKSEKCCQIFDKALGSALTTRHAIEETIKMQEFYLSQSKAQLSALKKIDLDLEEKLQAARNQVHKLRQNDLQKPQLSTWNIDSTRKWQMNSEELLSDSKYLFKEKIKFASYEKDTLVGRLNETEHDLDDICDGTKSGIGQDLDLANTPSYIERDENDKPLELVAIGDGTFLLVKVLCDYIERIDAEGVVIRRYETQRLRVPFFSVCISNEHLYATSALGKTCVSIFPLDKVGTVCKVKLSSPHNCYVTADDVSGDLLLSEYTKKSHIKIMQYSSPAKVKTEIKVRNLEYPGKIYVTSDAKDMTYMVEIGQFGRSIIKMFNSNWEMTHQIKSFPDTIGLAVTPGGRILLARNDKIDLYTKEPTFIKTVSCDEEMRGFRCLAYDQGFVFVCYYNNTDKKMKIKKQKIFG